MSNRLIINPDTPEVWTIELHPGINRVGSAEDNDFVINHPSISAHHCELRVADDGVSLKNLDSANSTFVAKIPITEFKLQNGHRVQLGAVEIIFESRGLPALPDAVNLPGDGAQIMVANPSSTVPPAPPLPPGLRRPTESSLASSNPQSTPSSSLTATAINPSAFAADSAGSNRKSLLLGLISAIVGGLIGMFAWYCLIRVVDIQTGWMAWAVGGLTGFAARVIAKRGSPILGIICGVCAMAAISGGT